MGYVKAVQVGAYTVRVRELTVEQVRDWLRDLASPDAAREIDLADYLLYEDEGLRLSDFSRLTDHDVTALSAFTPSQLDALLVHCREVNPRFFLVLGRVLAMGKLSLQHSGSTNLNVAARKSQNWFTRMFMPGPGAG